MKRIDMLQKKENRFNKNFVHQEKDRKSQYSIPDTEMKSIYPDLTRFNFELRFSGVLIP
jgi:hypothetical protein